MSPERKGKPLPIDIPRILEEVPDDQEFMTLAELNASSKRLFDEFKDKSPGLVRLEPIGRSAEGRQIDVLKIGNGKRKIAWVGTPHPNEPIGTLAIEFFSRYLCEHPELLASMDATFLFVKSIDPDGLVLNEGWLKGERSPLKYALNYYRPVIKEQPDLGFPLDYKTLHFNTPPAETQALMNLFTKEKPSFFYALHNRAMGGAYFNVTRDVKGLSPKLQNLVRSQGLPLHIGQPEGPYVKKFANGIHKLMRIKDEYDYYEENQDLFPGDPAARISYGAKSGEFLEDLVDSSYTLETEIPYFTADILYNQEPSDVSKRTAIEKGVNKGLDVIAYANEHFKAIKSRLPDSRLTRSTASFLTSWVAFLESKKVEARKPEYEDPASHSEVFDSFCFNSFYPAQIAGQVYRLALEVGAVDRAQEIKKYIEGVIAEIEEISPLKTFSLKKLVETQVGAALLAMQATA